jgi:tRNA-Thr(GGU) m(6)t(6)A37 methyltransferase TsaA
MADSYTFKVIGVIHSPCKEKFAVPRQAGLVPELRAQVEIVPEYARAEAFHTLEGFSHIWLLSVFHQAIREQWQPTVRPPRLGGNKGVGVFASRSPFRPNPIGMSLVELTRLERRDGVLFLHIEGCDLVDGTPIIDIKPYLPYADLEANARSGYTSDFSMASLSVKFSDEAQQLCQFYEDKGFDNLMVLVTRLIQQDPRPAYVADAAQRHYVFRLYDFDVVFSVNEQGAIVETFREIKTVV